jgi:hypothetical protein
MPNERGRGVPRRVVESLKKAIRNGVEAEKQLHKLEHLFFVAFCAKPYLSQCEPEYCTFRITRSCKYMRALEKIYQEVR